MRGFSELEEQARRLRQRLGIDVLWTPDMINVLHKLHEVFPEFELVRVLDDDLPDCEAKADFYQCKITIRESVYQDCVKGDPRARMTVAHEIAHLALAHAGTRYRRAHQIDDGYRSRNIDHEEAEARRFAGVFLVPTYLARNCKSAGEIAEKFGVSAQAAEIRFDQLAPLIKQGPEPSQRWASSKSKSPDETRAIEGDGPRRLPTRVVDFLTEARRRGHRVTGLDGLDD
jgi:Zn-dependent peptidase ImmA (M78 family)